jgi:hypothetical protein
MDLWVCWAVTPDVIFPPSQCISPLSKNYLSHFTSYLRPICIQFFSSNYSLFYIHSRLHVAWENMELHIDYRFLCLTLNSLHLIHRNGGSRCFSLRSGMAILFPFLDRLDSIRQPSRLAVSIVKQLHVLPFVMHACLNACIFWETHLYAVRRSRGVGRLAAKAV